MERFARRSLAWNVLMIDRCLVLDNVQEYCPAYEGGIARQSVLKVGTAGTAIRLEDCNPGAFDLQSHLDRVAQKKRRTMTVESLWTDIDWTHARAVQSLHFLRVLVDYVPELKPLSKQISDRFRGESIAKHRMREGRKTIVQPLGTNAERETETQGMKNAILDFDAQMGVGPEAAESLLSWVRGDGASYATTLRLQKHLCSIPDNHTSFQNRIATPEIWHTKATMINSMASNHYGPSTSKDPSSLSQNSNAVGFKIPSNLNSCDFYPTVRSMTLIWEARVLDCWRVLLDVESNLVTYFKDLASHGALPSFETLLQNAEVLVDRYASQAAHEQALSHEEWTKAPSSMKVPSKPALLASSVESGGSQAPTEEVPQTHQESAGFDGDRVLANSILFLQDFGWWIELAYAVPEGDIGRVFEIMKIWIFAFAGSSHQNYTSYLLEVYCLLRYEASKDLHDAILNNWLVNVSGELGKWIEGDLLQEHYNRWLEDMVRKRGGDFDDSFYRCTISPNVDHFLRLKEEIEKAFDMNARGKAHTSPHLSDELRVLLSQYKEDNLHLFCPGRTFGHAAINQFNQGYERLAGGKLAEFIKKSLMYADVVADIQAMKRANITDAETGSDSGESSPSESSDSGSNSASNSASGSGSQTAPEDDTLDEFDPDHSNTQLVSGSEYHTYLADGRLMHDSWREDEWREDAAGSSDEDEGEEYGTDDQPSDEENDGEADEFFNAD